jgi:hypothetical protein
MAINDYCTLAEVKASMPDNAVSSTTTYDALVTSLVTRISRTLDKFTGRKPGAYYVDTDVTHYPIYGAGSTSINPFSERLGGSASDGVRLWIGELAAVPTSVAVSLTGSISTYTAYSSTDFICGPYDALDNGLPYEWLELDLFNGTHPIWSSFPKGNKVVGKFGYSATVPDDIKEAAILMVVRMLRRAQQNYMNVATINGVGQIMQGDRIDDDIVKMIGHYRKLAI